MSDPPIPKVVSCWQIGAGVLFAALVALACCLPLLTMDSTWYQSHEGDRYLRVAHHFKEAFQAGHLYPRWLPNLYGGYGYPTFIYYQPGFFFAALPLSFLLSDPFQSMLFTVCAFFFVGGLGAFFLARQITKSTWFGLFGTLLFLLTPYVETNVYVRGALTEFSAMMWTPWPFFFLGLLAPRTGRLTRTSVFVFTGLVLSLTAIIVSHPATAMFYVGVFVVLALAYRGRAPSDRAFYCWIGLAIASALVLSSPYWLTFWRMKEAVDLGRTTDNWYHPTRHLLNLKPLFNAEWRFGASPWGMPIHLGHLHFGLAVLGASLGWRNRISRTSFLLYLGLIVAMTYVGYPLWRYVPAVEFVQFPWRLLSVIAILQLICIGGLLQNSRFEREPVRSAALLILALAVVVLARDQFQFKEQLQVEREDLRNDSIAPFAGFQHLTALDEFLPGTVVVRPERPRENENMVHPLGVGTVELSTSTDHSPYHIDVSFRTAEGPTDVIIDQFWFPGMRVTVTEPPDRVRRVDPGILRDGRMILSLPPNATGALGVRYDGPPGWRIHALFVAMWFVGLMFVAWRVRKRGAV